MAEITSDAVPSLGFTLEVSNVMAMTSAVVVAGLKSVSWSGFEVDSVGVTESTSEVFFNAVQAYAYRSKPGRVKLGQWNCTGNLILSSGVTGNQQDNIVEIVPTRVQKYYRVTFVSGKLMIASGFWKNFEATAGEGGVMEASWAIELDGQMLTVTYA